MKKKPKSDRKRLEDKLDILHREYTKLRYNFICQRCFRKAEGKGCQWSHYHGRRKRGTRWDDDNCVVHCGGCHIYLTSHPEVHRAWKIKQLGQEKYDKLMLRANRTTKFSLGEMEIMAAEIQQKINKLKVVVGGLGLA